MKKLFIASLEMITPVVLKILTEWKLCSVVKDRPVKRFHVYRFYTNVFEHYRIGQFHSSLDFPFSTANITKQIY